MTEKGSKVSMPRKRDPMRSRLMSVEEVSVYLGWHPNTVRVNLIYAHEIPIIRLSKNGKIWIDRRDLES